MDKWTQIRIFVEAVRRESFSEAGRQIGISPSAVSKSISRLEARLGVRLLNRTTRNLNLTEAGQFYLGQCLAMLEAMDSAEDALADFGTVPSGILKISSTAVLAKYLLLPMMPAFQRRYPKVQLDFQLTGEVVDLVSEGIDVAIRLGALTDSGLVKRKLCETRRIVCASPDYLSRMGRPHVPGDLRRHNCLRLSTSEAFNRWRFESAAGIEIFEAKGSFVCDNALAVQDYAILGGGIVRLSELIVEQDIAAGRLVPLLEDFEAPAQQIHAVYPHRKHVPAKVRAFVDFIAAGIAARPG